MDCLKPLIYRLVNLASQPLCVFLLTYDLYWDVETGPIGKRFRDNIPALVMAGAVAYRISRSKKAHRIRDKLQCKMHKKLYCICNLLCSYCLLNMTLVTFLSLQDFVYCTTSSGCHQQQPAFPARLWTKAAPCPVAPSYLGLAITTGVALVGTLILWQPEILIGHVENRLKQCHALADWMIEKIPSMFGAPANKSSDSQEEIDSAHPEHINFLYDDFENDDSREGNNEETLIDT